MPSHDLEHPSTGSGYDELSPPPELAPDLHCLWTMRGMPQGCQTLMRVVPDGCVDIILSLGAPLRPGASPGPQGLVVGPLCDPFLTPMPPGVDILAARFFPGRAGAFLGMPLSELADRRLALADVMGFEGSRLLESVAEARSLAHRKNLFASFLARQGERKWRADLGMNWAVREVLTSGGLRSVRELRMELGLSERTFQRRFASMVGQSPREFRRIARINAVIRNLRLRGAQSWSQLAADHGFSDQAHLVRDFGRVTGLSPAAYLRESAHVGIIQYSLLPMG